jgi:hypothetical protein
VNKKTPLKNNLLAFNGLTYDELHTRQTFEAKLEKLKVPLLKELLSFFNLDTKGKKDDLIADLLFFIERPRASDANDRVEVKDSKSLTPPTPPDSPQLIEGTWRNSSDPIMPKKPMSPYMYYVGEYRDRVKEQYPTLGVVPISKKLSEIWQGLSDAEKRPFFEQSDKDKERYEQEMKNYNPKV